MNDKNALFEEDQDEIITLLNENGEEIDFIIAAGIAYGGKFYLILQPVELLPGMEEDEALVFEVKRQADGTDSFTLELDNAIIDAVFEEYNRLLDEAEGE